MAAIVGTEAPNLWGKAFEKVNVQPQTGIGLYRITNFSSDNIELAKHAVSERCHRLGLTYLSFGFMHLKYN